MGVKERVDLLVARKIRAEQIEINGTALVSTALLLGTGEVMDLNGEAYGLVLDADADTAIGASSDDIINIKLNGAEDFRIAANLFTALSGSVIATNTIAETTAASGVTIDSALIKDGNLTAVGATALSTDIISEVTSAAGVTVDGVLIKDTAVYGRTAVLALSANGAITVPAYNIHYFFTKAGVAAMTIADPTATTHDGVTLTFTATAAQANTLDNSAGSGFFSSGGASKDIATWGGAVGDGFTIIAYQGKWYVDPRGVTNVTLG